WLASRLQTITTAIASAVNGRPGQRADIKTAPRFLELPAASHLFRKTDPCARRRLPRPRRATKALRLWQSALLNPALASVFRRSGDGRPLACRIPPRLAAAGRR